MKTKWQLIKTAPKDGTEILLFGSCGRQVGAFKDGEWWCTWYDGYTPNLVTHWMPLPAPPKQTA